MVQGVTNNRFLMLLMTVALSGRILVLTRRLAEQGMAQFEV